MRNIAYKTRIYYIEFTLSKY